MEIGNLEAAIEARDRAEKELKRAWVAVRREAEKEIANLKNEVLALHRERIGEVWYWQGDGEDHLESLTCPVLIEAEDLRAIVKESDRLKEALNDVVERHTTGRGEPK